jgi:hypothetical protein
MHEKSKRPVKIYVGKRIKGTLDRRKSGLLKDNNKINLKKKS